MAISDLQISEKTKRYLLKIKEKFQPLDDAQEEVKGRKLRRKDPLNLFELRLSVQPVRVGDGLAESMGKLYSLIQKNDNDRKLQHELEIDRLEGELEEEDRSNDKLLREIKKVKKVKITKDKKDKNNPLEFLYFVIRKMIGKIKDFIVSAGKLIGDIVGKITSSVGGFLGKMGVSTAAKVGAVAGGAALLTSSKGSVPRKQVYDYIRSKGVDHNHAMGMMANIQGESSFQPGAYNPNDYGGPSGGLFQWHDNTKRGEYRFTNMSKAIPDWQTNWKAQIDYALQDKAGNAPRYLSTNYSSSEEATTGWVALFERPKDAVAASKTRISFLPAIEKEVKSSSSENQITSNTPIEGKGNKVISPQPKDLPDTKLGTNRQELTPTPPSKTISQKEKPTPKVTEKTTPEKKELTNKSNVAKLEEPKPKPKVTEKTTPEKKEAGLKRVHSSSTSTKEKNETVKKVPSQKETPLLSNKSIPEKETVVNKSPEQTNVNAKDTNISARSVTLVTKNKNSGEDMVNASIDNKVNKQSLRQTPVLILNQSTSVAAQGGDTTVYYDNP